MKIETFEMERMQSTWENLVDYDLSESGVRPLTLRELVEMGFDLDAFLDKPLGYSQSNGTIELREAIAQLYPGATVDHIEVTNGTSEANYLIALSLIEAGDRVALEVPNYMQLWGIPRSLGATFTLSNCVSIAAGSPIGTNSTAPSRQELAWSTFRIPTIRPAPCSPKRPWPASSSEWRKPAHT